MRDRGYLQICHALVLGAAFLAASAAQTGIGHAQDVRSGEKVFRKCRACHKVGIDARQSVGPPLNDLFGRPAASHQGYRYSPAMRKAGADGLVWTETTLAAFLTRPRSFVAGTRMTFPGLKKARDRADLIAYLKTFSGPDTAKDGTEGKALLGASAAAIDGDPAYGEYLSGECVTCHRLSGATDGIPAIVGWPKETFIHALYEYKTKARQNPVMQTVTGRLGDEEMAALAAYFGSIRLE